MRFRRLGTKHGLPLLALLAVGALQGCAGAALVAGAGAGAGGYAYSEGVSRVIYPLEFDRVWEGTLAMLPEQDVGIRDKYRSTGQGKIEGVRSDDKSVNIELEVLGAEQTRVSIRVGTIPDRAAAEGLHRALARRLNAQLPF